MPSSHDSFRNCHR
ncbi:hypothetical protein A2U01_0094002, partial [Trifolium medium]|nr:hypothetical protein [Trifolium medium]